MSDMDPDVWTICSPKATKESGEFTKIRHKRKDGEEVSV